MFSKIRSLIFKLDPELAHSLAIKALKFNSFPKKKILKHDLIKTSIFGKDLYNPIGIAAGFDKDAEVYNPLFKLGFGFVEVGTVTPKNQYGNEKPRVFRLEEDNALINRLGFNNTGAEKVYSRISLELPKGLLGINIGPNKNSKNRLEDYLICLRKFYKIADYLTINISSPNTDNLRDFHNEKELDELLKSVINEKNNLNTKVPIAVKVSPDIDDKNVEKISEILIKHNIEIIIVSNTTDRNRENLVNINKLEKGGLSGKPLEKISNLLINKFYKNLNKKIIIIGAGGIDSGQSAFEKIINGASLIQLYTGMVYQGPNIVNKISSELIDILKKKGFQNISKAVGTKNWTWLELTESLYNHKFFMSKKCELTGKIPLKGHKVSHANNKTKRRFLPNLKKVKFKSEILNKSMKLIVSNSGVRSVDKKGSFDQFIKTAKAKNLSLRLKKLRKTIITKSA